MRHLLALDGAFIVRGLMAFLVAYVDVGAFSYFDDLWRRHDRTHSLWVLLACAFLTYLLLDICSQRTGARLRDWHPARCKKCGHPMKGDFGGQVFNCNRCAIWHGLKDLSDPQG